MQYHKDKLEFSQSQLPDDHPAKHGKWEIQQVKSTYFLISEDNGTVLVYSDDTLSDLVGKIEPIESYVMISRTDDDSVYSLGVFYTETDTGLTCLMRIDPDGSVRRCRGRAVTQAGYTEFYSGDNTSKGLYYREYIRH